MVRLIPAECGRRFRRLRAGGSNADSMARWTNASIRRVPMNPLALSKFGTRLHLHCASEYAGLRRGELEFGPENRPRLGNPAKLREFAESTPSRSGLQEEN